MIIKTLLLLTLIYSSPLFAQKKLDGFFAAGLQGEIPNSGTQGFGARFAGGVHITNNFLAGLSAGFTKIQSVGNLIAPFGAHFSYGQFKKNISLYLVAEPNYGVHDSYERVDSRITKTKGGFGFYGGGGMSINSNNKTALAIQVGYSLFTFVTNGETSQLKAIGIRVSVIAL